MIYILHSKKKKKNDENNRKGFTVASKACSVGAHAFHGVLGRQGIAKYRVGYDAYYLVDLRQARLLVLITCSTAESNE